MKHPTLRHPVRHPAGFTLLEMVIVLGIIAMILGGAIFAMKGIGEGAKLTQVRSDMTTLSSALNMYKLNAGHYPTTQQGLKALVERPTTNPQPRMWTRMADRVQQDPWGSEYSYRFPGSVDKTTFEIISKGRDMQEGTQDDISSQKID